VKVDGIMIGSIWGGNNVSPKIWIELLTWELACKKIGETKSQVPYPKKPATLAEAAEWLNKNKISTDISTLSRMKNIDDCHTKISSIMEGVRTTIIQNISLETCFNYFERNLLSTLQFFIPNGDMGTIPDRITVPQGYYEAIRYSLRGRRHINKSVFQFYQNDKINEPLSGYCNIDSYTFRQRPESNVYRFRELRRINPMDAPQFFIHVRGFVFYLHGGFYLIGIGLETESDTLTKYLKLSEIRRSQVEHEFLDNDMNANTIRGIKPSIQRLKTHPAATVIEFRRKLFDRDISWQNVGREIGIGTIKSGDEQESYYRKQLDFDQDDESGMLIVKTR